MPYVTKDHAYRTWFLADMPGIHTVWYEVYNENQNVLSASNEIKYYVGFGTIMVVVPDVTGYVNETAIMTAKASGGCDCSNYTYQWYRGKSSNGIILGGETDSTLYVRGVQTSGNYTCKVTCPDGSEAEDWGLLCVRPERGRTPPRGKGMP